MVFRWNFSKTIYEAHIRFAESLFERKFYILLIHITATYEFMTHILYK